MLSTGLGVSVAGGFVAGVSEGAGVVVVVGSVVGAGTLGVLVLVGEVSELVAGAGAVVPGALIVSTGDGLLGWKPKFSAMAMPMKSRNMVVVKTVSASPVLVPNAV